MCSSGQEFVLKINEALGSVIRIKNNKAPYYKQINKQTIYKQKNCEGNIICNCLKCIKFLVINLKYATQNCYTKTIVKIYKDKCRNITHSGTGQYTSIVQIVGGL